jgi:hypothetical protein
MYDFKFKIEVGMSDRIYFAELKEEDLEINGVIIKDSYYLISWNDEIGMGSAIYTKDQIIKYLQSNAWIKVD